MYRSVGSTLFPSLDGMKKQKMTVSGALRVVGAAAGAGVGVW